MGRANNTARSLIQIAKANGMDPCKIEGSEIAFFEYDEQERVRGFKPGALPTSPESNQPTYSMPGPDDREPAPQPRSKPSPNPYAGKSEAGA